MGFDENHSFIVDSLCSFVEFILKSFLSHYGGSYRKQAHITGLDVVHFELAVTLFSISNRTTYWFVRTSIV